MKQDDWQPIETAPKDGTEILAYWEGHMDVMSWDQDMENFTDDLGYTVRGNRQPSHWQPLPEPPK